MMNLKERPNHRKYIQVLRRMSPEERLLKAFELSDLGKRLFIHGLRKRSPDLPEEEFRKMLLERLGKCHNRNYRENWNRPQICTDFSMTQKVQ